MPDPRLTLKPVPATARFVDPDWYIWGGSMVRDEAGTCHLFYSRWPRKLGMSAWVTHSEVARATAPDPLGPFEHAGVALPARGRDYWDGSTTHNPTVHRFNGRYYLYYTGNRGDGEVPARGLNFLHRNNQRVGLAVAESPEGPWERSDAPLIDAGAVPEAPDRLCTTNPAITQMLDGRYLLIYKAVGTADPLPFGGPVVHLAAVAEGPAGPFRKQDGLIFTRPGERFPTEDPCIYTRDGRSWAIVKDFKGVFTGAGRSLALFTSADGLDWEPADPPLVTGLSIQWHDGPRQELHRLERPQLWQDGDDDGVLYCAASEEPTEGHACNIHIPVSFAPGEQA
jgi:hypothetical protein